MTTPLRTTAFALTLVAVACTPLRTNLDPASIQMPAAEHLTDGEIASIAVAAQVAQFRHGQLGAARGNSNSVRVFGDLLSEDYGALTERLESVLRAARISARPHPIAAQTSATNDRALAVLEGLQGEEFDREYMERQGDMTRWYLAMLDNALLPSAQSHLLREHLERTREATADHYAAVAGARPAF